MNIPRLVLMLPVALSLTACESERPAGPCIGIDDEPVSGVRYEYSTRNIIVGILFVQTIIPPVIVVLDELRCPVGPAK